MSEYMSKKCQIECQIKIDKVAKKMSDNLPAKLRNGLSERMPKECMPYHVSNIRSERGRYGMLERMSDTMPENMPKSMWETLLEWRYMPDMSELMQDEMLESIANQFSAALSENMSSWGIPRSEGAFPAAVVHEEFDVIDENLLHGKGSGDQTTHLKQLPETTGIQWPNLSMSVCFKINTCLMGDVCIQSWCNNRKHNGDWCCDTPNSCKKSMNWKQRRQPWRIGECQLSTSPGVVETLLSRVLFSVNNPQCKESPCGVSFWEAKLSWNPWWVFHQCPHWV